ncbi:uncharacterized protein LOC133815400 [Humulus lupulus]|uniref:uncharacterized protein LOC133815400 n=1 Tax=Humulus lupulus TaxID=3486 RepID=UPI002B40F921|nr:uncharacterized protein LOC133815400 [Humulus lupulus]
MMLRYVFINLSPSDPTLQLDGIPQEVFSQEKAQTSISVNQEFTRSLKRQGHGEYRDISEGDFLGEVTGSKKMDAEWVLGAKDDFTTKALENLLVKKGTDIVSVKKKKDDGNHENSKNLCKF